VQLTCFLWFYSSKMEKVDASLLRWLTLLIWFFFIVKLTAASRYIWSPMIIFFLLSVTLLCFCWNILVHVPFPYLSSHFTWMELGTALKQRSFNLFIFFSFYAHKRGENVSQHFILKKNWELILYSSSALQTWLIFKHNKMIVSSATPYKFYLQRMCLRTSSITCICMILFCINMVKNVLKSCWVWFM
jgi:hypothetical protein